MLRRGMSGQQACGYRQPTLAVERDCLNLHFELETSRGQDPRDKGQQSAGLLYPLPIAAHHQDHCSVSGAGLCVDREPLTEHVDADRDW